MIPHTFAGSFPALCSDLGISVVPGRRSKWKTSITLLPCTAAVSEQAGNVHTVNFYTQWQIHDPQSQIKSIACGKGAPAAARAHVPWENPTGISFRSGSDSRRDKRRFSRRPSSHLGAAPSSGSLLICLSACLKQKIIEEEEEKGT